MENYFSFETERLSIVPVSDSDAEFIYELLNTPKWIKYIGDRGVKSADDAREYIAHKMQPQLKRLGYSSYVVSRKIDRVKIGICGLYDREGLEGIDIGFAFLPEYENCGYAYESAVKVMDAAKKLFGLSKVRAITMSQNLESQRLLERLGLKFIKFTRVMPGADELMLYETD